jgi:biopolymer transport protein ExbD
MAMNVGSSGDGGEPDVMMDINTTPLIDVMLVLIIMLIITIPIQLHSVNLNMPIGTPPPQTTPPEIVNINVDFDGTVSWNDQPIPDKAALEGKLSEAAAEPVQPEIHLNPNKLVAYKYVAAVMAAVQRKGLTKFVVVGNEQLL